MKKANRNRRFQLETLESRKLMAADASFNPVTGALVIRGTSAADQVALTTVTPSTLAVSVNSSVSLQVPPTAVRSIMIDLGAGSDYVVFDNIDPFSLNPDRVDILMGSGTSERLDLWIPSVGILNVDARSSRGTAVGFRGTVTNKMVVDMGSDSSADSVATLGADINKLELSMGGGNDQVLLLQSIVHKADIHMGSGNDSLEVRGTESEILSGTVNGDGGSDTIDPAIITKRAKFVSFENKRRW